MFDDIVFERIMKILRRKTRSIAKRNLGKIYRKKLSMFESCSEKNKSRVLFYVE